MEPESTNLPKETPKRRRLTNEELLSALVALLSILTAVVAFHASRLDSASNQSESIALQQLIESNTEYLFALQDVMYDFQLFDQWVINDDEEDADYFYNEFSDELLASFDRNDGPFDEQYYLNMYSFPDELYESSIDLFVEADTVGDKADNLQMVMMLYALGLAFAGWASLVDESKSLRAFFAFASIGMLVVGSALYLFYGVIV